MPAARQTSLVSVVEGVVHEARDERRLAHRLLAQEHQLELPQRVSKVAGGRHVALLVAPLSLGFMQSLCGRKKIVSSLNLDFLSHS